MACGCIQTCRTCGARILWVKTTTGKNAPIDAVPVAGGNIRLTDTVAFYMSEEERAAFKGPTYVSHFATCPQAKQHRRPK